MLKRGVWHRVVIARYRLTGPPDVLAFDWLLNAKILRRFGATVDEDAIVLSPVIVRDSDRDDYANLRIGPGCLLSGNNYLDITGGVTLGQGVSLGPGVTVMTHNSYNRNQYLIEHLPHTVGAKPVVIGDGAGIKAHSLILMGVTVGREAVVTAGSVVNIDVPDRHLASGVPARIVTEIL